MSNFNKSSFDSESYMKAFESFLTKMGEITDEADPAVQNVLSDVCRILRIAQIRVISCAEKTTIQPLPNECTETVVYQDEGATSVLAQSIHNEMENGSSVTYEVYAYAGADSWSDIEQEKISLLIDMFSTFLSRIRTKKVADRLTYWDSQFNVRNLNYYMKAIGECIQKGTLGNYMACYFNLKHFSAINQQIGRELANVVISRFLEMLENHFGEDECICRVGGDNFTMLFKKERVDTMTRLLEESVVHYGDSDSEHVLLSTYAGLYDIPEDGSSNSPTVIMDYISSAVNMAKVQPDDSVVFYSDEVMQNQALVEKIETLFPEALENKEIQVYYQPKVSLQDDGHRLVGAEALCRWFHDDELISPASFIPVLERGMDICKLDFYMLDMVCSHIRGWLDEGRPVVKVSVNLSRRHLTDTRLLEHIMEIIDRHNVPHQYIGIELTETSTDIAFTDLKRVVKGLQDLGVSTYVDDFGMGYSSLNLIRDISWDVLKIDKSFLPDNKGSKATQERKHKMLKHVIAMAKDMNLETIVEGVETPEHIQLLKDNNCFLAQGFFFDRPLPVEEFQLRLDKLRDE